jgi:Rrf2 family nitric oxide-sensitive transcriptional repressor
MEESGLMRLTVYADYSLRLLLYLAVMEEGLATIPTIADSYGISRHHLVKVAHQLGVKGYITTVRGKKGGLKLARPASEIKAGSVVRQMEPDMALVPCLEPVSAACPILPGCLLHHVMEEAREAFLLCLDGYTLKDLCGPKEPLRHLLGIQPFRPGASGPHSTAAFPGKPSGQNVGTSAKQPRQE